MACVETSREQCGGLGDSTSSKFRIPNWSCMSGRCSSPKRPMWSNVSGRFKWQWYCCRSIHNMLTQTCAEPSLNTREKHICGRSLSSWILPSTTISLFGGRPYWTKGRLGSSTTVVSLSSENGLINKHLNWALGVNLCFPISPLNQKRQRFRHFVHRVAHLQ